MGDGDKVRDLILYDMTPSDIGERHHRAEANGRSFRDVCVGVILITILCCCLFGFTSYNKLRSTLSICPAIVMTVQWG